LLLSSWRIGLAVIAGAGNKPLALQENESAVRAIRAAAFAI
jgi:hypothetical protein